MIFQNNKLQDKEIVQTNKNNEDYIKTIKNQDKNKDTKIPYFLIKSFHVR